MKKVVFGWYVIFLFIPLLLVVGVSFLSRGSPIEFIPSLLAYETALRYWKPFLRSLGYAFAVTFICLILGFPVACVIAGARRWKRMLLFLVILPFWTNFLVRIYGWKIILRHLELLGTEIAVLIGLTYIYLPFMILPLFSALERFDSRLYLAARDLGASGIQAIIKVVIPVIAPGVRVGILFVFVLTFGDFVVNDLLGGAKNAMIGSSIRDAYLVSRNWPLGAALTVLSTLFLLIFIWCIRKWRTSGT